MTQKDFYILVEGPDDHRFFHKVVKPFFEKVGNVHIIECSHMRRSNFIVLTEKIKSDAIGYMFVRDFDKALCLTARKNAIHQGFPEIEPERIMVVVQEIESWYVAGISKGECERLDMPFLGRTDELTKSSFESIVRPRFGTAKLGKLRLLDAFSLDEAKKNNSSFAYLFRKFVTQN